MKLSFISSAILVASASAFAPDTNGSVSSTKLYLFGGGGGKGEGESGPGMMDQLAMFKKAQEVASKKNDLDKELQKMDIIGEAADGKVKVTIKYIPAKLPVNPNPGYDVIKVDIDEDYLGGVSSEDLSAGLVEAIRAGETQSTVLVTEKYQELQNDMAEMLGGMQK